MTSIGVSIWGVRVAVLADPLDGVAAGASKSARRALWIALPYISLGILDHYYSSLFGEPIWLYWLLHFVEYILVGALLLWAILRVTGWSLPDIGIAWPPGDSGKLRLFAYGILGIVALLLISPVTDAMTEALGIIEPGEDNEFDYDHVLPVQRALRVLTIVYLCLASSIVEEIYYRGVLWRAIAPAGSGMGRKLFYVLFSALLFAVSHTEQGLYGVVSTAIWGAFCSMLLLALRNLWPLILGHAATNLHEFLPELLP